MDPYLQRVGNTAPGMAPDLSSAPTDAAQAAADAYRRKSGGAAQQAGPAPGGGSGAGGGAPVAGVPAAGAPAAPAGSPTPALGTQTGNVLRRVGHVAANAAQALNQWGLNANQEIANDVSYLPRVIGGFARDAGRAAVGAAPAPNAGQPLQGAPAAPQLTMPYPRGAAAAPVAATGAGAPAAAAPALNAPASRVAQRAAGAVPATNDPNYNPAADNISANNLAAAMKMGSAPPAPQIDSGITLGARRLNYGAMVNGVPTFSDGSGDIPRTVGTDAMARLTRAPSVGRADAGALANPLASDALGYTPSSAQQVATLVRNAPQAITGSRPSAQQFADADRLAIASQDPRSAAGIAARNLSMDAQYGRGRAAAAAQQGLQQLTDATDKSGIDAQQAESQQALETTRGGNALAAENLRGQFGLADAGLGLQRAQLMRQQQPVTLSDGTLATRDPITGVVTPSRMPDGTAAKTLVTKEPIDQKRTQQLMDALGRNAAQLSKSQMPPANAPVNWQPDPSVSREAAARNMGLPVAKNAAGKAMANINGQWVAL